MTLLTICIKVSDDDFEILLLYLDGLKGKSREVTVKQAEDIMEKDEDNEGEPLINSVYIHALCCNFYDYNFEEIMKHRYIVQCTWFFLFRDRTCED